MNIQEIDIDEHLVIPIPVGQKVELATIIAIENGWLAMIDNTEIVDFNGSGDEINTKISTYTPHQRTLNIINGTLTYEDTTQIVNPVTAIEFGKTIIMDLIGGKVRKDVRSYKLKELKSEHEVIEKNAMDNINLTLDNDLGGIIAL